MFVARNLHVIGRFSRYAHKISALAYEQNKKLRTHIRGQIKPQKFSDLLVIDFEATCIRGGKLNVQEIIEFPAIRLSTKNFLEVARFHKYVRPTVNEELSDFCTELTGICQSMVDDSQDLTTVLEDFKRWMDENKLNAENCAVISYGDWDIQSALYGQCQHLGVEMPSIFDQWINVKQSVMDHNKVWPGSLPRTVKEAGLTFVGRHHSGLDDCVNIGNVARNLAINGYVFGITTKLKRTSF